MRMEIFLNLHMMSLSLHQSLKCWVQSFHFYKKQIINIVLIQVLMIHHGAKYKLLK